MSDAYPLMTMVSSATKQAHAVGSRLDRTRVLPVRRMVSVSEAVAWIRNAVDDDTRGRNREG